MGTASWCGPSSSGFAGPNRPGCPSSDGWRRRAWARFQRAIPPHAPQRDGRAVSVALGAPLRCVRRPLRDQIAQNQMCLVEQLGAQRIVIKHHPGRVGADGLRILVDRLWPRGLAKAKAAVDSWMREVAPSTELRRWFDHDPRRWGEFRRRYARELRGHRELLDQIRSLARNGRVTLLFGARDELHKDAVALRDILLK